MSLPRLVPLSLALLAPLAACSTDPAPAVVTDAATDAPVTTDLGAAVDAPVATDLGAAVDAPVATDLGAAVDAPVAPDVTATPDVPAAPDVPVTPDASTPACRVIYQAMLPNQSRLAPTLTLDAAGEPWAVWYGTSNQVNAARVGPSAVSGAWQSTVRTIDVPVRLPTAVWNGDALHVALHTAMGPTVATFDAAGATRSAALDLLPASEVQTGTWLVRAGAATWAFWRRRSDAGTGGELVGTTVDAAGTTRGPLVTVAAELSPREIIWDGEAFVMAAVESSALRLARVSTTGALLADVSLPGSSPRVLQVSLQRGATGVEVVASDLYRAWYTTAPRDLSSVAPWTMVRAYQYSTEWAALGVSGSRRLAAWIDTRSTTRDGVVRVASLDSSGAVRGAVLDVASLSVTGNTGDVISVLPVGDDAWLLAWRAQRVSAAPVDGFVARIVCPSTP